MLWKKTDVDQEEVRSISQKYGVDTLLSSILTRRGITSPQDIKFFLEDDFRFLHNPFLFKDMEDVIDRLHLAKEEGEKVLVYGDKDVDGVTSCVLLYESLISLLEFDATWLVPTGTDSYGLSETVVEEAYKNSISLLITVDCGISAFNSIKRANELGIDVIIIDHHNSRDNKLPDAKFIINPKVQNSTYPFKGLAASGVTSKVIWAICFSLIDTLYKSKLCFLHLEKIDNEIKVTGSKLYNLCKTIDYSGSSPRDLIDFLTGEQILLFNQQEQMLLLNNYLGSGIEIHSIDIKPEIERVLKGVGDRHLNELLELSKMRLYSVHEFRPIDLIVSLFHTYIERRYYDSFNPFYEALDLVCLGTVADLMPLVGENRILVKKGIKRLERCSRSGLQALLLKQNLLGQDISSKDISWNIAPILNSAGRMKKADVAVNLLLGTDEDQKNKATLDILALNKERRSISDNLWDTLYQELHTSFEEFGEKIVILFHESMVRGVSGIIAARTQSTFSVPAIIIAKEGDILTGSIRSDGSLDISTLFSSCSELLLEWGGHNCAAGFSLNKTNLIPFQNKVTNLIKKGSIIKKKATKDNDLIIDAFLPINYLNPDIINIVDRFEPYGEGNPHLVFATKKVKILDINFIGKGEKKHLKMLIEVGEYKWPAIFWNSAHRVGVDFTKNDIVDIAYKIERNNYGGNQRLQLNLFDILK